MPTYGVTTATSAPRPGDYLSGEGHRIFTRVFPAGVTISAGTAVGAQADGSRVPVNDAAVTDTITSAATVTTYDLTNANVDADTMEVFVGASRDYGATLLRGTGAGGVDQVVLSADPGAGVTITVHYKLLAAKPVGVVLEDVDTSGGGTQTAAVVEAGAVVRSKVTGLPAHLNYPGAHVGGLILD